MLSLLGKRFWVFYHWVCFVLPFGFWQSFSFALVKCLHFTLSVISRKPVPVHEGMDKKAWGVELPFMLGILMADFTDSHFPCAVGSAWAHVPSCRWSCTFEKKAYGTLSHTDFLSVLISSILIYLIFTLESSGMQTHVRTSSWESTEVHLHLLALVHGHTTVCIILALDKANSSMDIKSWHSIYMLLSGPVSVPLTWGDTFLWKSSLYMQIYLYLSRCSWNISQKKQSYLQTGLPWVTLRKCEYPGHWGGVSVCWTLIAKCKSTLPVSVPGVPWVSTERGERTWRCAIMVSGMILDLPDMEENPASLLALWNQHQEGYP